MKRPSFQFYPSDWLRDTGLRSCSTGARGLWIDMICFMHEGTPYGYLKVGEKVILPSNLARMVGETLEQVEGWLDELKQANVFDIEPNGTIVSRRMVRDEEVRAARASGGKLGGNPLLLSKKVNHEVKHEVADEDKQNTTPSSSLSSSSSASKVRHQAIACPPDVDQQVWVDWVQLRKTKRATVTQTVIDGARKEAEKAGMSLSEFLAVWCRRGSQGLEASWLKPSEIKPKADKYDWLRSDTQIIDME